MKKRYKSPESVCSELVYSSICGNIESGGEYNGEEIDSKSRGSFQIESIEDEILENEFKWNSGIW